MSRDEIDRRAAPDSISKSEACIEVRGVSVAFAKDESQVVALDDVDLSVCRNEFISLLGPSGCGKTTLLRVMSGLTAPASGEVRVEGELVVGPLRNTGMMFQAPTLLKWRDNLGNVLLAGEVQGMDPKAAEARARQLIRMVGLEGFEHRYPRELSGGMQQRIALARALFLDPPLLFMDEPFGALDALTRDEMGEELVRIWRANPKTVVFVTHSIREAIALSDRIVVLTARPGRVIRIFSVDEPRPREPRKMGDRYDDLLDEIHRSLRPNEAAASVAVD